MSHPESREINIAVYTNSLDSTYRDYQPMIFQLKGPFASVSITQEDLATGKRHVSEAEAIYYTTCDQKDTGQAPDGLWWQQNSHTCRLPQTTTLPLVCKVNMPLSPLPPQTADLGGTVAVAAGPGPLTLEGDLHLELSKPGVVYLYVLSTLESGLQRAGSH